MNITQPFRSDFKEIYFLYLSNIQCDVVRIEFYQQTVETNKKKSKKESSTSHSSIPSNQTLLGKSIHKNGVLFER